MPKPCFLLSNRSYRFVSVGIAAGVSLVGGLPSARAEFAPPPESPYRPQEPSRDEPPISDQAGTRVEAAEPVPGLSGSSVRFNVGPAVLLQPAGPGLFMALDIGPRPVGVRASAAWLRAGSKRGLAAYTGELWIDLGHRDELHPIVGAGACFLHGGALGQKAGAGAGVLRGALEYELPI